MGRFAMGEAAHELRKAAAEERRKAQERRAIKASVEAEALAKERSFDEPEEEDSATDGDDWGQRWERRFEEKFRAKHARRAERKAKRAAKRAQQREEGYKPGCCGGTAQSIVGGIMMIIGVNLLAVWIGGLTGRWEIYEIGWPVQLVLISMALCMVMMGSGSIWLLIPAGILFGNGVLFTYYSLTNNWEHWAFLWPLEPLLIVVTVWFTIIMAGRGRFSSSLARFLGMVLWLLGACLIVIMAMLLWPWFYDVVRDYYAFGLDIWANLQ
jgi:hypothetical protein